MRKTLLVDGDILLYKFGFGGQSEYQFGEDTAIAVEEMKNLSPMVDEFLNGLRERTKAGELLICLTSPNCFRYDILPTYKHNRKNNSKPLLYQELKDYLLSEYPCKLKERLEADDIMGILATKAPDRYIVGSIDKDLQQIPGWHFNWSKDTKPRRVSKEEADLFFYRQCLSGDPVDGFSGVPGIGKKKADKVLEAVEDGNYWSAIKAEYEKKGLDESYALTQARMARILRAEDYDFKNNAPILWSPHNG